MKPLVLACAFVSLLLTTQSLAVVNYNTTGSTLSCNGVVGCVQNTSTSVSTGGLTFTYNTGSGSGITPPSIINLGNIVSSGTGSNVSVAGILLTINVNSTPPGVGGTLPNGAVTGTLSTSGSRATLSFSPSNTTTTFGTLPGVILSGGGQSFVYQVSNISLGIQAPAIGNPVGQTSIQGAVALLPSIAANAGTSVQSTFVNTLFGSAPAVTVKDGSDVGVSGVNVTFTAPASGASGLFANNATTITVPTNGSGIASAPFTANSVVGGPYAVSASAAGYGSVNFQLTNSAATVSYNTTGSTLSCNGVVGCAQNTTTSVSVGGLTFTYNTGSGSGVLTPSIVNLGNLVTTGTGSNVNVSGLLLTINVNSTPPGASGTLPNGNIVGHHGTNNSSSIITFGPNNTTTSFGTLPGVTISGGGRTFTYQVLNPILGLQAPTIGNPIGQTSIQGSVGPLGPSNTPPPCELDVDGNGTIDALTDGLLVLRAMFGLTGTAVTNGAIGAGNPSRTTWAQIQPYLNGNCGSNFAP